ncbi:MULTISPECIES: hypothetical protein [unclassified Phycicoccus]|nr:MULTISPECIES: hypothetical protein [unclassified Phycicoccus]
MTNAVSGIAALVTGAVLALLAIFGGTAALTPSVAANNSPVVNYDGN